MRYPFCLDCPIVAGCSVGHPFADADRLSSGFVVTPVVSMCGTPSSRRAAGGNYAGVARDYAGVRVTGTPLNTAFPDGASMTESSVSALAFTPACSRATACVLSA